MHFRVHFKNVNPEMGREGGGGGGGGGEANLKLNLKTDVSAHYEHAKFSEFNWGSCEYIRTEAVALSPTALFGMFMLKFGSNLQQCRVAHLLVLSTNAIHIQQK